MLESALAAGIAEGGRRRAARRRAADAGGLDPRPPPRPRPGGRRLGLPQPLARQRDQVLRRRRAQARRRAEARDRAARRGSSERAGGELGRVRTLEGAARRLPARARDAVPRSTSPAGGSCSTAPTARPTGVAPAIFERLGAEVEAIGDEPDGRNINEGCGSTHPEALAERVVAEGRRDRLRLRRRRRPRRSPSIAEGTVRDGDELLALIATELGDAGERSAAASR